MFRRTFVVVVAGLLLVSAVSGGIVAAQSSTPAVSGAVAFDDTDGVVTGNTTIEIRFESAVDESSIGTDDIVVTDRNGASVPVQGLESGATENDRQLFVDVGAVPVSTLATVGYGDSRVNVTQTTTTLTEGPSHDDRPAFEGETVAFVGNDSSEELVIRAARDGRFVAMRTVPNDGQVYALDTSTLENDSYFVAFDGDTAADRPNGVDDDGDGQVDEDRLLELLEYPLDVTVRKNPNVDDATVVESENVTGVVSTNRVGERLTVLVLEDEDPIRSTQVTTNGSGEAAFDFAPIAIDQADDHFTVVARHEASGTVAVQDVKVSEVDHDAGMDPLSVTDQRGDVVEIPIVMSPDVGDRVAVDHATVTIGGPDVGYRANVTVSDWNDDQEVVLRWNTYQADGSGGAPEFGVEPTDEDERDDAVVVDDISTTVTGGPDDVLDAGSYDVAVRSGQQAADSPPNETGVVFLTERTTEGISAWTAPTDADVPLETNEEVREARADGTLTRTSAVAGGDRLVLELNASGIGGAVTATESTNQTERFVQFLESAATLETVQTNPTPNRAPKVVDLADSAHATLVVNESSDTYRLVVDTDDATVVRDTDGDDTVDESEPGATLEDGDAFETTFEIPETDGGLAGSAENVSVQWRYDEPSASVDTESVDRESVAVVAPRSAQIISGDTSVAPGTELRVRIRDDAEGVAFLEDVTVTVDENRSWAATVSFEDVPNATEFTVSVRRGGTVLVEEDGLVRSAGPTTTSSTTATPVPTTSGAVQGTSTETDSAAATYVGGETASNDTVDAERTAVSEQTDANHAGLTESTILTLGIGTMAVLVGFVYVRRYE